MGPSGRDINFQKAEIHGTLTWLFKAQGAQDPVMAAAGFSMRDYCPSYAVIGHAYRQVNEPLILFGYTLYQGQVGFFDFAF